mgnify:FL=1
MKCWLLKKFYLFLSQKLKSFIWKAVTLIQAMTILNAPVYILIFNFLKNVKFIKIFSEICFKKKVYFCSSIDLFYYFFFCLFFSKDHFYVAAKASGYVIGHCLKRSSVTHFYYLSHICLHLLFVLNNSLYSLFYIRKGELYLLK